MCREIGDIAAITIFADPSVNFALQFQPMEESFEPDFEPDDDPTGTDDDSKGSDDGDKKGEVVSLDKFAKIIFHECFLETRAVFRR